MAHIPYKVKVGQKFGLWTIKKIIDRQHIECECKCGVKKLQRQTDLLRGVTTKCPNCHLRRLPTKIVLGAIFGDWTVINIEDFKYQLSSGKQIERKWHVRCKCGKEGWLRTSHLTLKLSRSCAQCANMKRRLGKIGDLPLSDINRYKYSARSRNFEWNVENEELWEKFQKQKGLCALSGIKLIFSESGIGKPGAKDIANASLDRIDSSKSYIKNNVQWVHKYVNNMKQDMSDKEFIEWCKLIAKYNN